MDCREETKNCFVSENSYELAALKTAISYASQAEKFAFGLHSAGI
jgi:hypothetical protein